MSDRKTMRVSPLYLAAAGAAALVACVVALLALRSDGQPMDGDEMTVEIARQLQPSEDFDNSWVDNSIIRNCGAAKIVDDFGLQFSRREPRTVFANPAAMDLQPLAGESPDASARLFRILAGCGANFRDLLASDMTRRESPTTREEQCAYEIASGATLAEISEYYSTLFVKAREQPGWRDMPFAAEFKSCLAKPPPPPPPPTYNHSDSGSRSWESENCAERYAGVSSGLFTPEEVDSMLGSINADCLDLDPPD